MSFDNGLGLQEKHNHSTPSGALTISLKVIFPKFLFMQGLQKALSHLSQHKREPPSPHQRHCSSIPNSSRVNGPEL